MYTMNNGGIDLHLPHMDRKLPIKNLPREIDSPRSTSTASTSNASTPTSLSPSTAGKWMEPIALSVKRGGELGITISVRDSPPPSLMKQAHTHR